MDGAAQMDSLFYHNCINILREELMPALGCTEPIAVAYAAAKCREVLAELPASVEVYVSGNIVKNVRSVTVPNSGGLRGIEAAALLGIVGGEPERKLEVLDRVTQSDIETAKALLNQKICRTHLAEGVDKLYIRVCATSSKNAAAVTIEGRHTNITRVERNGECLFDNPYHEEKARADRNGLTVESILAFAQGVRLEDVEELLERQASLNMQIAQRGLEQFQGVGIATELLRHAPSSVYTRARAMAAAASEARMSGCSLPVVINSGSGNQGITVSVPVAVYAKEIGAPKEKLLRALVISNLISIHLKKYIGDLSAFCGAVTAACGAGAAICYLSGGGYAEVSDTITNALAAASGILCDGAKPSCAAKISCALDAAFLAVGLANRQRVFNAGDGLIGRDIERTIQNIGYIGRVGMENTDVEILNLMLRQ